ncbi:MAG: alpha-N-arabinofuranosidase [Treponema sp.]|jgi:alpha-N-arabinofuranosidase|nr:alpha-N-arabinofuranosidase [Treponema sp.]
MTNTITLAVEKAERKISRHIYGHFAEHLGHCIYGGIFVGEGSPIPNTRGIRNDVVSALKKIRIPNLRWPGGCFADEYHWQDGIGPAQARPKMVNTNWGGFSEDNSFGTHEFLDLCALLGCEPYICGNVGSGTVRELSQWVEYVNSGAQSPMTELRAHNGRQEPWKTRYWGIGNESWGCGGNMRAEYYADNFRRYAVYARNYPDARLYRIACGPSEGDYHWTETLMARAGGLMDGLSLHYYTVPGTWLEKGAAADFDTAAWYETLLKAFFMEELVTRHSAVMDKHDPQKRVGLVVDEWGTWFRAEPGSTPGFLFQQSTLRDALVAGLSLNIFNNHADRVHMANIAQTVNVLQALIHTEGEKMLLTPTYHVFDMYQVHQGALLIPAQTLCAGFEQNGRAAPLVSVSASLDGEGRVHISLCNIDAEAPQPVTVDIDLGGRTRLSGTILTGDAINSRNTYDEPSRVAPAPFRGAALAKGGLTLTLPPRSVVVLEAA